MLDQTVSVQENCIRNLPPKFVIIGGHIVDANQVWYVEDEGLWAGHLKIRMINSSHFVDVNMKIQEVYKLLNG